MKILHLTSTSAQHLWDYLETRREQVIPVTSIEAAMDHLFIYEYDIVLLSHPAPATVREIRAKHKVPIVCITEHILGSQLAADNAALLNAGADTCCGPDRREVHAFLLAVFRRSFASGDNLAHAGDLTIDFDRKVITFAGEIVKFTGIEYSIMEFMFKRLGQIITKPMFLDYLYGGRDEPEQKIIDVFFCKLRKKIPDRELVQTVWGRGYRLCKLPSSQSSASVGASSAQPSSTSTSTLTTSTGACAPETR